MSENKPWNNNQIQKLIAELNQSSLTTDEIGHVSIEEYKELKNKYLKVTMKAIEMEQALRTINRASNIALLDEC
ncbi:hypothetical protein [Spartinivicinus ruber]|uniref:hypothetical protein n=1 Tax=Spartinivicinus ruber TaxID=2683272 RepID=UPI0013D55E76|nr:hypothetical protein [Spartinivicinus ruber]